MHLNISRDFGNLLHLRREKRWVVYGAFLRYVRLYRRPAHYDWAFRLPAPPVDDPPLTPMYDSLTTNLPHPIMAYPSYPFPPGTLLYPPAATVLEYLNSYATHFDISKHIRVNTAVETIDWDPKLSRWRVRTSQTGATSDNAVEESTFDLVIVANGHYRIPYYPPTPGLSAWQKSGKVSHAAWYRHAHYVGDTVLVVGRGPSGIDVADEMRVVSKTLIHSYPEAVHEDLDGGALKHRGRIVEFLDAHTGIVRFADGTTESGIDHCILATGYEHWYPFLPPHLLARGLPPPVPPLPPTLYNSGFHTFPLARQIFPLVAAFPPSRLAVLALPYRIIPFPFAEAQTRAVLRAFAEPQALDPAQEAVDIVSRYEELRAKVGDDELAIARAWHKMEYEQFKYRDELHRFAGGEYTRPEWMVKDWELEMWRHKVTLRAEWKELVRIGEAEKWVEGVGESGGEEGVQEWVELTRRIVKRAEERQAQVSIDTVKMNRL
jgi:hypothetical protein